MHTQHRETEERDWVWVWQATVSSHFSLLLSVFNRVDTNDSDKMLTTKQLNVSNGMLETRCTKHQTIENAVTISLKNVWLTEGTCYANDYFSCFWFLLIFLSHVHSILFLFFLFYRIFHRVMRCFARIFVRNDDRYLACLLPPYR